MMMVLLAKILKMSWLDLPEMQVSMEELNKIFDVYKLLEIFNQKFS